jgi:hypothetical protein
MRDGHESKHNMEDGVGLGPLSKVQPAAIQDRMDGWMGGCHSILWANLGSVGTVGGGSSKNSIVVGWTKQMVFGHLLQ